MWLMMAVRHTQEQAVHWLGMLLLKNYMLSVGLNDAWINSDCLKDMHRKIVLASPRLINKLNLMKLITLLIWTIKIFSIFLS